MYKKSFKLKKRNVVKNHRIYNIINISQTKFSTHLCALLCDFVLNIAKHHNKTVAKAITFPFSM